MAIPGTMVLLVRFASGLWTAYKVGTRADGFTAMTLGDPYQKYHRPQRYVSIAACSGTRLKLLDQVRDAIRTRHYSYRTEACLPKPGAQAGGLRRIYPAHPEPVEGFIFFHHKRRPAEMGPAEITQFLTSLAVDRHVSAWTQNQALAA